MSAPATCWEDAYRVQTEIIKELWAANAALLEDKARLDWLEQKKPILWALEDYASGPYWLLTDFPGYTEETASQHKTARAAIDAARKEAQP